MSEEKEIIKATFYGLDIYRHILESFYPPQEVLKVADKDCVPMKNPYNDNKPTLMITRGDWEYLYHDQEIRDFKGGPLDFAAFHYKLQGKELLQRINDELRLHVVKPEAFSVSKREKAQDNAYVNALPHFTWFKAPVSNVKPYKDVTLLEVYKVAQGDYFDKRTQALRAICDKLEARTYKARNFDYVCFSGTFTKRGDAFLKQHSGLMVLDFDDLVNWLEIKTILLSDPFFETELLFRSPSGNGLKWVVCIDTIEASHEEWYKAIEWYVKRTYGLITDKSGKDVSRACFIPHDPDIYINPQYLGPEYG